MKIKDNKRTIELTLNDESTVSLTEAQPLATKRSFLDLQNEFKAKPALVLLKLRHNKINTVLDLTHVVPYMLLYFNKAGDFRGASYSLNSEEAPYLLQTACKTILFVKQPHHLSVNSIKKLNDETD